MIVEQLIFTILAFGLFVYIFLRMIQKNDTSYIKVLVIQALGIAINFISVLIKIETGILFIILKYIFGILIPIAVIYCEKKGIPFMQITNVLMAKIYLKLGNNKKAKESLSHLIDKYPKNYLGHKMLAEIYELEGGMRKAIDEYVLAIDINKHDYDSYYKISELLTNLDKSEEATEMLTNLLSKKPDYYKATELLGNIYIENEMYKEAANIYIEALKYNPYNFELNYSLGIAYTMLNDFHNAKLYYEKAAEINSLSHNSKYSLAEISLIYKELNEAESYFMEALEDDELSADSYLGLSRIWIIRKDREKAIQFANIAIDINPAEVIPKIKRDTIFISIMDKLSMPFNYEEPKDIEKKLSDKELKAKKHLEAMFELSNNLDYTDINILKNNISEIDTRKYVQEIENENEIQNENQKERE